ncbi:MAG TPA: endolytic transglycosylase MltG [Steroidobacter sp.]|nr:endolytic transglycosylase MltG [Steroidobacter sp.]
MRAVLRTLFVLLALGVAAGAAVLFWAWQWLDSPIASLHEPMVFEMPRGATLRGVAASLQDRGVLERPQVWTAWARLTGRAGGLRAGEYELRPGTTPRDLLKLLNSGRVLLHSITFVEGAAFLDVRRALAAHPAVRNDHQNDSDEEIMRALGAPGLHPEGQFFPDTYHFARGTSDLELLSIAHRRMREALEREWAQRAPDLPLASAYEALILASIVEKETALDRERPQIAGVFVERLRRGMRLQTDPTVIYGMQQTYEGNIRRMDLLRDTPYNTYTRAGLPPTPISMPGLNSIRAAARPEATGALFFVATGEGDGSHHFSRTLAEHNAAVHRYLRRLRRQ